MNIKEHIEAGHYPLDDKGRALVPCEGVNGSRPLITIYATDHPTSFPICGRHPECADAETYTPEGRNLGDNGDLLPPSPRKVKVTLWAIMGTAVEGHVIRTETTRGIAEQTRDKLFPAYRIVELTGEYEEPWT